MSELLDILWFTSYMKASTRIWNPGGASMSISMRRGISKHDAGATVPDLELGLIQVLEVPTEPDK